MTTHAQKITISDYVVDTLDGEHVLDISFTVRGIPLGLANSLRRVLLTDIPVVGFSNEWDDDERHRKILITENTSGLHNEFLSHRLCLVPLCMYKNNLFQVSTTFNQAEARREYVFSKPVPSFMISKENTEPGSMLDVTSSDFLFLNENNQDAVEDSATEQDGTNKDSKMTQEAEVAAVSRVPTRVFNNATINTCFPLHPITQDPILINLLKTNNGEGEKMTAICRPTIGQAYIHSSYCPVGTVSMSFEKQSSSNINRVFRQKVQYMNQERKNKKLPVMSKEHEAKLKESFKILDSERIYKTDPTGGPSGFLFEVESTGVLTGPQLVLDALCMLEVKVFDVLRCISVSSKRARTSGSQRTLYALEVILHPRKISLSLSDNKLQAFVVSLDNENHTLGNCIAEYLKKLYLLEYSTDAKVLEFASYVMKHPLKERIDIILKLDSHMSEAQLRKLFQFTAGKFISKEPSTIVVNPETLQRDMTVLLFYKCLLAIIQDIRTLKAEWQRVVPNCPTSSSFTMRDQSDFSVLASEQKMQFVLQDGFSPVNSFETSSVPSTTNVIDASSPSASMSTSPKFSNVVVDEDTPNAMRPQEASLTLPPAQSVHDTTTTQSNAIKVVNLAQQDGTEKQSQSTNGSVATRPSLGLDELDFE